jgi:glucosamine--fructose-6-phosphate aminotransferase (isomerizing)
MQRIIETVRARIIELLKHLRTYLKADVYFGRGIAGLPGGSLVFFPLQHNLLGCGIAGIVSFINKKTGEISLDITEFENTLQRIEDNNCSTCDVSDGNVVAEQYLGGKASIDSL